MRENIKKKLNTLYNILIKEDICGIRSDCSTCPLAILLQTKLGDKVFALTITKTSMVIGWVKNGIKVYPLPEHFEFFIKKFDAGQMIEFEGINSKTARIIQKNKKIIMKGSI